MVFVPDATKKLHQHQAMALINRWAKLKDYWYNDDLDELYALKSRMLTEWLSSGEVVATGVIKRESSFFENMRKLVKNEGKEVSTRLTKRYDDDLYDHEDYRHVTVLVNLTDGQPVTVPLPEPELSINKAKNDAMQREYEAAMAKYKADVKAWREIERNSNIEVRELWAEYSTDVIELLKTINTGSSREALRWCENIPTQKQLQRIVIMCGDKLPSNFDRLVTLLGLTPLEPKRPTYLPLDTEIEVDLDNYVEGTIPVVDEAFAYARNAIICKDDESLTSIAERWFEVELYIGDILLSDAIESLLNTCKRVLSGRLKTAEEIYEEITFHNLDLSDTLGLRTHTDRYGNTEHAWFGKWHEINLDPQGLWLVEFQSQVDPTCTFHMPYREAIKRGISVSELPSYKSDVTNYGRAVTDEEKSLYPIEYLLSLFDLSADDFPCELRRYQKSPRRYHRYDFDYYDEFDAFDEFDYLDYLDEVA